MSIKSPRLFTAYEENIRAAIRGKMTRGHLDVYISLTDKRDREKKVNLDEGMARAYFESAEKINKLFPGLPFDVTVTSVLRYPDVLKTEDKSAADDELISALDSALAFALDNLNKMREAEGKKLEEDMLSRMDTIEQLVGKVEDRAPAVAENYRLKLQAKMKKILEGVDVDEGRLLTEAAVFSDKSNIDEELTRLQSHISQFRAICREKLVGRKLDFLIQEFNRESNTVCSKSNDIEVTRLGLALKNEIEKVREQVQNVE